MTYDLKQPNEQVLKTVHHMCFERLLNILKLPGYVEASYSKIDTQNCYHSERKTSSPGPHNCAPANKNEFCNVTNKSIGVCYNPSVSHVADINTHVDTTLHL